MSRCGGKECRRSLNAEILYVDPVGGRCRKAPIMNLTLTSDNCITCTTCSNTTQCTRLRCLEVLIVAQHHSSIRVAPVFAARTCTSDVQRWTLPSPNTLAQRSTTQHITQTQSAKISNLDLYKPSILVLSIKRVYTYKTHTNPSPSPSLTFIHSIYISPPSFAGM